MITFWTDCDDGVFRDVIKKTLKNLGKGIEYRKVTFDGENVHYPEEGELVVAMGSDALELMQKEELVPKKNGISKMRGVVVPHNPDEDVDTIEGNWMFAFDPSSVKVDMKRDTEVRWDILLADRFNRTGNLDPELGECDYQYVDDFSDTIQYIKDKYNYTGKRVDVALDTETMGLFPWYPEKEIVCIQISVEEKQAHVVYTLGHKNIKLIIKQLKWILNSKKIKLKGANFKYDLTWIRVKYALECTNFTFDTLLAGSMLNENRSNSLSGHSKEYTTIGGYDRAMDQKYDKGHMEDVPKDDLLVYAGGDTDACLRISNVLKEDLRNQRNIQHFYANLLHPAARTFEDVEYHGVYVDANQFQVVRNKVSIAIEEATNELIDMIPRRLKLKHQDKKHLLVPAVLMDFLFTSAGLNLTPKVLTPKAEKPAITKDHLMMFVDNPAAKKFIDAYSRLNAANKTRSTYIDGFLEHLRPDGKFHPTYMLYAGSVYGGDSQGGTNTGRTSVKDPAIQTLPKRTKWAKDLRSCYTAPPGHVIFQVDFSEGELRIAACHANETTMINTYLEGGSLHGRTGAMLSGYDYDEFMSFKGTEEKGEIFADFRYKAKASNFGLIYGMQHKGYREYCRIGFDLHITMQEAKEQRGAFFDTYSELPFWHSRQTQEAHNNKSVVSPLGRVRHLPLIDSSIWSVSSKAERQAINAPIQSTLSDLCMWSMSLIRKRYTMQEVWLAGMTHDSIYGYIPEEHYMERLAEIKHIMENLPIKEKFQWEPQIQFPVDVEISTTHLGELEEINV